MMSLKTVLYTFGASFSESELLDEASESIPYVLKRIVKFLIEGDEDSI